MTPLNFKEGVRVMCYAARIKRIPTGWEVYFYQSRVKGGDTRLTIKEDGTIDFWREIED